MQKSLDILLIEDDLDDVDFLKDALNVNKVSYKIEVIMQGDKACNYLKASQTLPAIIVLDLNLPKISGRDVLLEIKSSPFTEIPVIVLTTSSSKDDIDYCNNIGISKFITKPATIEGWNSAVNSILNVALVKFN